jgi:polyketide cyclase/dehydrase/lipid transport protein
MKVGASVIVPAGPEDVWVVLLQWERQPEWMVDAVSVGVTSPGRTGVGTRIDVRTRILGLPVLTDLLEVTEWDPPRRLVVTRRGFVRGTGAWVLDRQPNATRVQWSEEIRVPVPVLGELALLAYRPIMRRLMRRSLTNLAGQVR